MNRFIDPATIKTIDFYDRLLYKYYGKVYHGYDIGNGCDCTVACYYWNGKYYMGRLRMKWLISGLVICGVVR